MTMARVNVRYSRKVSDGNYGSREVSMSIEHDAQAIEPALDSLFTFLKNKVDLLIKNG